MARSASPLAEALSQIGDRWSLLVVDSLREGPARFTDLIETLDGIAPNVLSQRLKHLEEIGVVVARTYSRRPVRSTYELTARGRELLGALRLLAHWGSRHGEAPAPQHAVCGTPLEPRWWCSTCASAIREDDAGEPLHYV